MLSAIEQLNPEQRLAATTIQGPLLVLAGAGTGKTKVITCRIAYMIDQGIPPSQILGVTFTNKAAREMRERLDKLISPEAAKPVTLGTFHSFCARVLHRHIQLAGNYNSGFSIADDADQVSLIRQAAAELGYPKESLDAKSALEYISKKKNALQFPEDAVAADADDFSEYSKFARVYQRYQQLLELQNTLDFDDMLMLTLKIFEEHPEVLEQWRETYHYLLVDEYQDTNAAQFRIIKLLAGKEQNLCVVGDDDQSIYSWRGADVTNILDFPDHFPGAKEIKLEQNYRSTNAILKTANSVIAANEHRHEKNLWSAKGEGETVKVFRLQTGEEEASFICNVIQNMVGSMEWSYSDFAILYRSNYLSRTFEQELRSRGIQPRIIGGQAFFQRKEVKDAAAYLKLIVNRRDDQSLLRVISVPPRGIGDKAILKLRDLQKDGQHRSLIQILGSEEYGGAVSKVAAKAAAEFAGVIRKYAEEFRTPGGLASRIKDYLTEIGYLSGLQKVYKNIEESEKRLENVMEFVNYAGFWESRQEKAVTLDDFLESYSLLDDNDKTEDEDADGPVLTTVHASKGLEFPIVFIAGMEQGLFPHERAMFESEGEAEERRLFYVAITRAREQLFMTYAATRFKYHEYERRRPSQFLKDLPEDCVEKPEIKEFMEPTPDLTADELRNAFADILKDLRS